MILITGATGNVGSHLVDELVAAGAPVRAFVRDLAKGRELAARGVQPALGRFEDEAALRRALAGVERLFLLSPPGDAAMVAAQTRVADLAVRHGVRHVVKLSSIAADEHTDARIIQAHRMIERHIECSELAWTHLRPHWFMQNELGQAASIGVDGVLSAPDVGRISIIDARDIAAAAARVLTEPGHEGRAYTLTGPEALDYGEVAATLSSVLGRPVAWNRVTLEEARGAMRAAGLPVVLADGFTEILGLYGTGGTASAVSPDLERLLGRPGRTFAQFAEEHREAFSAPAALAA